jgi:transcriptional regulator GlxA family with amidase domain
VFARAAKVLWAGGSECTGYRLELASTGAELISCSCGISLVSHRSYEDVRGPVDTLLVVGGQNAAMETPNEDVLRWLRRMGTRVRRIGSVCTGAFLLGAAGLLDNRRATTHWQWCDELQRRYPDVRVEMDRIFIRDETVYTSAGITAGMDLALAMVEEDYGSAVALQIARELVLFLRRPGGQSQFSATLTSEATNKPLRDLQAWMADHLREPVTVEALANRVSMSPRNFARVFVRETGMTPARFVERLRVDAARRWLEDSSEGLEQVAERCGFGSVDSLRRSFAHVLLTRPKDYRQAFRTLQA